MYSYTTSTPTCLSPCCVEREAQQAPLSVCLYMRSTLRGCDVAGKERKNIIEASSYHRSPRACCNCHDTGATLALRLSCRISEMPAEILDSACRFRASTQRLTGRQQMCLFEGGAAAFPYHDRKAARHGHTCGSADAQPHKVHLHAS